RYAAPQCLERKRAVHRAAVEVQILQHASYAPSYAAFSGAGRTINGDRQSGHRSSVICRCRPQKGYALARAHDQGFGEVCFSGLTLSREVSTVTFLESNFSKSAVQKPMML